MKKVLIPLLIILIPLALSCSSTTGNDDGNGTTSGYTVTGKVVDTSGAGITNAGVSLSNDSVQKITTTNAQGNYTFEGIPNGTYVIVPAKEGYTFSPELRYITVSGANATVANFTGSTGGGGVEATFDLTGTWIYSMSNLTVEGKCPVGSPVTENCVITQTGNSFTLVSSAGAYSGIVSGADYSGATPATVVDNEGGTAINYITVTASSETSASGTGSSVYVHPSGYQCVWTYDITLTKSENGDNGDGKYTVSGRVVDTSGVGIAGVMLSMGGKSATTDAQGNYTFSDIYGGYMYNLKPTKSGYTFSPEYRTVSVNDNLTGKDFIGSTGDGGDGGYTVSGRIVDDSGAGIADVNVSLAGAAAQLETTTDSDGYFTFTDTPPGSYALVPDKSDYEFTPQYRSIIIGSSDITGNDFVGSTEGGGEEPAGDYSISGKVVDSAGYGIPKVEIEIAGPATDTDVDTDAQGNYSFENLADGTYYLTPDKSKYSFLPASIEISIAGANVTADNIVGTPLGGENGFTVSGRIVDGTGSGLEGAEMELWNLSNKIEIFTDAQGNYSMVDVPNGNYYVDVSKDGYEFTLFTINITVDGANVTVDDIAGFPEGAYTVSGRVVDSTGAGAANVIVYLYFANRPFNMNITNADGNYYFENIPNQHYTVKAGTGYTPEEQNITVNGADVTVDDFVRTK